MTERRRRRLAPQQLVRRPDGSLYDEATMRGYLRGLDARALASRVTVDRLSRLEPEIAAFEVTSRGVRAER